MGINIFRWGPTGQLDTICNVKTQVVVMVVVIMVMVVVLMVVIFTVILVMVILVVLVVRMPPYYVK